MKARHASTTTADNTAQPATGIAKHTAGPWKKGATHCNPNARCFKTSVFSGKDMVAEATTFFDGGRFITPRSSDQARLNSLANARLIAVAPELLELLKLTYGKCHLRYDEDLIARSRAAIAKAETLA